MWFGFKGCGKFFLVGFFVFGVNSLCFRGNICFRFVIVVRFKFNIFSVLVVLVECFIEILVIIFCCVSL